jgi:N6-adenosine-specific RNA methylase IME4
MLNRKYQIIYADPAWDYEFGATSSRFIRNKYATMSKEAICELPIKELASDNSALFLWVTYPKLDWAFDVIKAWGFTYKTAAFTWVKTNENSMGLFWGMGYYTRSNPELCLLATKGEPLERKCHDIHSVVISPVLDHSHKPAIIREFIVQLFGDLPRIELFARRKVDGWDCWGNEVESDIALGENHVE